MDGNGKVSDIDFEKAYGRELKVINMLGVGGCFDTAVEGTRLYMAGSVIRTTMDEANLKEGNTGYLHVADISVPSSPHIIGSLYGLGNVRQMEVRDGIAFIVSREDGLFIIDTSDPSNIQILSHYDTIEFATGIDIYGDIASIGNRIHGVELVDISDLRKPVYINNMRTGEAQSVDAADGYLYAGIWGSKELVVCDIRNPHDSSIVARVPVDGRGDGVFVDGKYCYVATGHDSRGKGNVNDPDNPAYGCGNGLEIYDVSDPKRPVQVSIIKLHRIHNLFSDWWSVTVINNYAFLAHSNNGIFIINVTDKASPSFAAYVVLPNDTDWPGYSTIGGICIAGGYIYAAGVFSDLFVIDASVLTGRAAIKINSAEVPADAGKSAANMRYSTAGHKIISHEITSHEIISHGIISHRIISHGIISNIPKDEPAPAFNLYKPGGQAYSAAFKDGFVFAACGSAGIHVIDTHDGLKKANVFATKGFAFNIIIKGNLAYVAEGMGGLSIWRLSCAEGNFMMELAGHYDAYGRTVRHAVLPGDGKYALIQAGCRWFQVIDVSNPEHPAEMFAHSPYTGMMSGRQIGDGLALGRYACCFWHAAGLFWYDLAGSSAKPSLSPYSQMQRLSMLNGITFMDGQAVFTYNKGYILLDPSYKGNLNDLPHYGIDGVDLSGKPSIFGNMMFITERTSGKVTILDITDIKKPFLLRQFTIARGTPDIIATDGVRAVIPAGYEGLMFFDLNLI